MFPRTVHLTGVWTFRLRLNSSAVTVCRSTFKAQRERRSFSLASVRASQFPAVTALPRRWKATGLNTDQGPYFRIVDAVDAKQRLRVETPQVHGNVARSWITVEFNAGQGTEVVDVELRRNRSLRFDNLIAGSLHVFAVSHWLPFEENVPEAPKQAFAGGSLGWIQPTI